MKMIFLGATSYSLDVLKSMCEKGHSPSIVFTIPRKFSISYSETPVDNCMFSDIGQWCEENNIKHYEIESGSGKRLEDYHETISGMDVDVIIVAGWYYKVPSSIRKCAKHGCWGMHASLLPEYGGGAPLVWAIINGEKRTGVTLFKMNNAMDAGEIIDQAGFEIENDDTIAEVYGKATQASIELIINSLDNIDEIEYKPQNPSDIEYWPQRKPEDGKIDFSKSGKEIYDFIRAQGPPYPGAFFISEDGCKIVIEKARLEKNEL